MRVRIIFLVKNKGAYVPFHHQYLLSQLIRGIIINGGDERFIYYNFFNFSGLKGQTKVSRNGLHFYSSKATLVLSCMDKDFIDHVLRLIFSYEVLEVGNLQLIPESVEIEHLPEFKEEMKYICISPLVVKKPSFNDGESKKFISPDADEFSDLLYDSTMVRMEKLEKYDADQIASFYKFQLIPDKDYLRKIREKNKKFARIYPVFDMDVKYEVRGYTFPFTLYAAKEVQKFLFVTGLGYFTHKGFGMLDIANSDPANRTDVYDDFKKHS